MLASLTVSALDSMSRRIRLGWRQTWRTKKATNNQPWHSMNTACIVRDITLMQQVDVTEESMEAVLDALVVMMAVVIGTDDMTRTEK